MNNTKLSDYIRVYDNVVKQEHCRLIIESFEAEKNKEAHDNDLYKFHQLNLTRTPGLENLAQAVAGSLIPVYEDYFNALGMRQFVTIDTFEDIRIKKYERGSSDIFKTHTDVSDYASAARFAIAIIYLNDNDGHTTFPKLGIGVPPKTGRVVVFPPFWMFPHAGETPRDNDKYIMMTCLHYK